MSSVVFPSDHNAMAKPDNRGGSRQRTLFHVLIIPDLLIWFMGVILEWPYWVESFMYSHVFLVLMAMRMTIYEPPHSTIVIVDESSGNIRVTGRFKDDNIMRLISLSTMGERGSTISKIVTHLLSGLCYYMYYQKVHHAPYSVRIVSTAATPLFIMYTLVDGSRISFHNNRARAISHYLVQCFLLFYLSVESLSGLILLDDPVIDSITLAIMALGLATVLIRGSMDLTLVELFSLISHSAATYLHYRH